VPNKILTQNALTASPQARLADAGSLTILYRYDWNSADELFIATWVSAAITSILGYDRHECLQPGWWHEHVHPDDACKAEHQMYRLFEQDESEHTYRFADKSGEYRWIQDHRCLIRDADGAPKEVTGSWLDVTCSCKDQLATMGSGELSRTLIENSPTAMFLFDDQMHFIEINPAGEKLLGYSRQELLTMSTVDIDVDLEVVKPEHEKLNRGEPIINYEHLVRRKDGEIITLLNNSVALKDGSGNITNWYSFLIDITDMRKAEQAYRDEALRNELILQASMDGVIIADERGQIVQVNPAYCQMVGYTANELLTMNIAQIEAMLTPAQVGERIGQVMRDGSTRFESQHRHKDSHVIDLDLSIFVTQQEGQPPLISAFVRDISQRLKNEQQMRLLKSAVAAVNESIIVIDINGVIVYVNPAFEKNTGFKPVDVIGKTESIFNNKLQPCGFYEQFWETIKAGKPWSGRILDCKKDGTSFPVHLSVAPILDVKGEITHFVAVHEDLTTLEAMQQQMMQSQKMEAVGTMVGGIAHDFNNLLASIVGNFYLIRVMHSEDDELVERIHRMEKATEHGANLIRQMLTFARKDLLDIHPINLRTFIKETHKLAVASMPENIRFGLEITSDCDCNIMGDATQLQQVLLNLVTNARHAIQEAVGEHEQAKISVELDCSQPPAQLLQQHPEMITENDWCCIRCVDNGCGIEADDLEHVFEPFFTTKEVGKGTGLGLSMVYGAVQNHRGLVDIDSRPGQGTIISIWLPQHSEAAAVVVDDRSMNVDGGGRGILLVDDEASLRKVLVEVLQQSGFTMLEADDGEQAVMQFKANRDAIALVLMDVVMPNKGGVAAAQEIRALGAEVPIIFQTGYGEQTQLDAAAAITNSESLQKPVQIHELLKMIMSKVSR